MYPKHEWTKEMYLAHLERIETYYCREAREAECSLLGCVAGPEYFMTNPPIPCCIWCGGKMWQLRKRLWP